MKRTDLIGVSPEMHRYMLEYYRRQTPAERIRLTLEMCEMMRKFRADTAHLRPEEEEPWLKKRA